MLSQLDFHLSQTATASSISGENDYDKRCDFQFALSLCNLVYHILYSLPYKRKESHITSIIYLICQTHIK